MLDRDTVRRRLEGDGISYTEFSYMLLQANDYVRAAPAVRMRAADRRLRSVGQHHRRGSAGAPDGGRDGARADHAAGDGFRGQEVRQVDRRWQPLARPGHDQPVRLVPVLHQHRRRRRRPVSAVVHLPVARRAGRAGAGDRGAAARASGAASAGPRADHAGARGGGDGRGRTCQPGAVRPGGVVPAR